MVLSSQAIPCLRAQTLYYDTSAHTSILYGLVTLSSWTGLLGIGIGPASGGLHLPPVFLSTRFLMQLDLFEVSPDD